MFHQLYNVCKPKQLCFTLLHTWWNTFWNPNLVMSIGLMIHYPRLTDIDDESQAIFLWKPWVFHALGCKNYELKGSNTHHLHWPGSTVENTKRHEEGKELFDAVANRQQIDWLHGLLGAQPKRQNLGVPGVPLFSQQTPNWANMVSSLFEE